MHLHIAGNYSNFFTYFPKGAWDMQNKLHHLQKCNCFYDIFHDIFHLSSHDMANSSKITKTKAFSDHTIALYAQKGEFVMSMLVCIADLITDDRRVYLVCNTAEIKEE